jgi:DNA end-binding protein Ku
VPPRPTFKGFLRLSLVSVPVRGFTAAVSGREIRFNQLHKDCNQRIKYQKVCPEHGEVAQEDIVKGYEYTKDQYVLVDPEEIRKLQSESDKTVSIKGFVSAGSIDPNYFSGSAYFFQPDGPAGQKPYQLLREAMEREDLVAIGSVVMSNREQMVVVRPLERTLVMNVLQYHEKVRRAADFEDEVKDTKTTKEEEALTKTLVDASLIKDFDFSAFRDNYVDQMTKLIEAKVEGEEIVAAPEPEEPKIINLMEALKQSVESAKSGGAAPKAATRKKGATKAKAKLAPSSGAASKRKRKAG